MGLLLAEPERIRRAVIVGASPGIEDEAERAARAELDEARARDLETQPFEDWLEAWYGQPLFAPLRGDAGLPRPCWRAACRADRRPSPKPSGCSHQVVSRLSDSGWPRLRSGL